MFLDSTTNQLHPLYVASQSTALRSRPQPSPTGKEGPEPPASSLLSPPGNPMERGAPEYSQSGLPSPLPSNVGDSQSEASSADHVSAAPFASQQEARSATYSASATPTSEYSVFPPSARSAAFPEHIQRSYHPANNHGGGGGGMAQTPTNPSIAAPNPTYPHGQYATYATPGQEMTTHGYTHPGSAGLYAQPRPDWSGYGQSPGGPIAPGHHVFPQTPTNAAPAARQNQVYSFVPIPGAQQHKRPRRRYEEIERMYKCGWNGCEKAYGTLNHLNAHVTMQAHGQKRTPEEFKEIRKEWKQKKKEDEAARKAEEDRHRQNAASAVQNGGADPQATADGSQPPTSYAGSRQNVTLPPLGFASNQYPAPSGGIQQSIAEYAGSHVYPNYTPPSPYGQPNQQMYNQHNGGPANH